MKAKNKLSTKNKEYCLCCNNAPWQEHVIPLESLFIPLLKCCHVYKEKCICGMSSRVEYVGCAHDKLAKSFLPRPKQLLFFSANGSCLVSFIGLDDWSLRKQDTLAIQQFLPFNKRRPQSHVEEPYTATTALFLLPILVTS